jgi:predicted AlkP superfamily pyrophosphatase or phosphodiesterase
MVEADGRTRVVTVSGKARVAVLTAGHTRGHTYYFEDDVGWFVTSSYYRDTYPEWMDRFNTETMAGLLADSVWECSVPEDLRGLARRDDAEYENWGRHTTFPHIFANEVSEPRSPQRFYTWWRRTPKLDVATLALAEEAVKSLSLGSGPAPDYLAVGLSQLDRVGHRFGPLSLEYLDALLSLDRELGRFLEFLDESVGEGRYIVTFSSDHGVVPIPAYRQELGEPGKQITRAEFQVLGAEITQIQGSVDSPADVRELVMEYLKDAEFVADVVSVDDLDGDDEAADSFVALYRRSYYPGRIPEGIPRLGLILRLTEGTHGSTDMTTHGSPYLYDRHVPLVFMGPGVPAGTADVAVRTVDVAPTLAALVGVAYPDGLDGRVLSFGRQVDW